MSDGVRQITTEEQREQLHDARNRGGRCAACGRDLADDETVYIEKFMVDTRKLVDRGRTGTASSAQGPVGIECASSELLEEAEGKTPERCAGCGRPVVYGAASARRQRALCSKRCSGRAVKARHMAERGEG
jgi:hypothetical protein